MYANGIFRSQFILFITLRFNQSNSSFYQLTSYKRAGSKAGLSFRDRCTVIFVLEIRPIFDKILWFRSVGFCWHLYQPTVTCFICLDATGSSREPCVCVHGLKIPSSFIWAFSSEFGERKGKAISEKQWWGSDYFWSCSCALRGILYFSSESWKSLCWFYILSFSWPSNPAWCKAGVIYFAVFRLRVAPALCNTSCQPFHPIRAEDNSC